jgi:hypothetical protein
MSGMQTPELFDDEEQKDDDRTASIEKVLPFLPEASRSPRGEVDRPLK